MNENYFKIWSKDMAYVLGFWFADGNICKQSNRDVVSVFSISQHKRDCYILEKISKLLNSNKPIKSFNKDNNSYLRVFSAEICKDIIKLGGKERKSLGCNFPKIPQDVLSSFVRGFFDGDGSIVLSKKTNLDLKFVGACDFIDGLEKAIYKATDIKGTITKVHFDNPNWNSYKTLVYTGRKRAAPVLEWFYFDVCDDVFALYLRRKYERFLNWKQRIRPSRSMYVVKAKFIDFSGKEYLVSHVSDFCKKHGLNLSHMYATSRDERKHHKGWTMQKILSKEKNE